jgi:SagB-type dehydrogenase family enzyme
MPELGDCTGYTYLRETFHDREAMKRFRRPAIAQVETFKKYPEAKKVKLPRHWQLTEEKLAPLLQNRRSLRRYSPEPLLLQDLAFMLWSSQGITATSGNYSFRTVPSGGALYPVETYLSVHRVEGLSPGLYHFDVESFCLERLSKIDSREKVADACLNQKFMAGSAVTFLWSAVFRRCMSKYGNRGMRYILLDAGHICQNVLLAAEATGSGGCPIAAFYDNEVNELLGLEPDEESVLYAAAVGRKI